MKNFLIRTFKKGTIDILYIIGSIFMGPFIAISSIGFTSGGGDYCDSSYWLPEGGFEPRRDIEFGRAETYAKVLSAGFIVIGFLLFVSLIIRFKNKHLSLKEMIIKSVLILLMMAGYGLVYAFSGSTGQNC